MKDASVGERIPVPCAGGEETTGDLELDACWLVDATEPGDDDDDDGPDWGIVGIGMPTSLGSGIGVKPCSPPRNGIGG